MLEGLTETQRQEIIDLIETVVSPVIDDAVGARLKALGLDVPVGPREYAVTTSAGEGESVSSCTDVVYGPDWVKFVAGEVTVALYPRERVQRVELVREEASDAE